MAETDLKVQIRFEATGDKELAKAFTATANAQKKLEDVTKRYNRLQKKTNRGTGTMFTSFKRLTGQMGKLRLSLATVRSNLLVLTFGFNLVDRTVGRLLRSFAAQEDAVAKLNQTLKSTKFAAGVSSRELQGLASRMQKLTGIGDETILSMQGVLLTFTQIKGDVFKDATEAILNISVALGQDLQQSAIQVGKALNDPAKGVSALQRVGIQFTDEQKAMIKQLDKTNQTAKAQAIILKELELQFGGTASNVSSTSISLKRLSSAFGDLMESGGGKLAPLLDNLITLTTELVEGLNETPEGGFTDLFVDLNEETRKTIAFQNHLGKVMDQKVLSIMKEIGFVGEDVNNVVIGVESSFLGATGMIKELKTVPAISLFSDANKAKVKEFGEALRENPGKALNMINDELRDLDLQAPEVTFFDDFIQLIQQENPEKNIEDFITQTALTFNNEFGKFDKLIGLATANDQNQDVLGLRNFFLDALSDGILSPEEITDEFQGKSFQQNLLDAMNMTFGDLGLQDPLSKDISPFADILNQIFTQDFSFDENQGQIDLLNSLKKSIEDYQKATGLGGDDNRDFLTRLSDGLVKFKEENEDAIKGFDDLANSALMFTKGNKEVTISLLKLRRALAIGNTLLAFTEALKEGSLGKALSLFAAGMAKVAQIKGQLDAARKAAIGADFVTQGRQMIMVGDNPTGRERVQVTPLGNTGGSPGGDSSVTINLNGNILGTDEFVRDTLIPEIENAVGRNLA
mgnify:CR=1 FL=1